MNEDGVDTVPPQSLDSQETATMIPSERLFLRQEVAPEAYVRLQPIHDRLRQELGGDYTQKAHPHMTIAHIGHLADIASEVAKAGRNVTPSYVEEEFYLLIVKHARDLPQVAEVKGDHLGTLGEEDRGRKRVVLLLDPSAFPADFHEKRSALVQDIEGILRKVGVGDVEEFLKRSPNLSYLKDFNMPHISLGWTGSENQIPNFPVTDVVLPLEKPSFVSAPAK